MRRLDDRILVDSVAQAKGENRKESQIPQIILKLVLLTGNGILRYRTAIGVNPADEPGASIAADVVDHSRLRKILEAEFADKAEVALLRKHVAGSDRDSRRDLVASKREDSCAGDWVTGLAVKGRITEREALTSRNSE